uniref:LysM domain-containing protein n=1 Tax=Ascaris lumbricoides TaxID=6252 RepID=A0A0M3INW9_ASCLU
MVNVNVVCKYTKWNIGNGNKYRSKAAAKQVLIADNGRKCTSDVRYASTLFAVQCGKSYRIGEYINASWTRSTWLDMLELNRCKSITLILLGYYKICSICSSYGPAVYKQMGEETKIHTTSMVPPFPSKERSIFIAF